MMKHSSVALGGLYIVRPLACEAFDGGSRSDQPTRLVGVTATPRSVQGSRRNILDLGLDGGTLGFVASMVRRQRQARRVGASLSGETKKINPNRALSSIVG